MAGVVQPRRFSWEPLMSVIEHTEIVAAAQEWLFDFTQDYSVRQLWDPFPDAYEFVAPSVAPEVGAIVKVRAKNGQRMTVRYVSYNRPRAAAIEMVEGPWFIARFHGTWSFYAVGPHETRVTFKYNVSAGPRLLSPIIQPFLTRSFQTHARNRVIALRDYVLRAASAPPQSAPTARA